MTLSPPRSATATELSHSIPLLSAPASPAQVDWYEAYADLDGERVKLQVFSMRSMASGAAYHRAYLRATQQAFLEAHELAFHFDLARIDTRSKRHRRLAVQICLASVIHAAWLVRLRSCWVRRASDARHRD